jgi:putative ABC transport system permease protein
MMDTLQQDIRYALRQLARNPAFTVVAVLTLALGIGANTALFSVIDAVLLRSLPYPAARRLVVLWGTRGDQQQTLVSIPDVLEWRARNHSFEDVGIVRQQSVNLTGAEAPDRLSGEFVTASTLELLGARTALGRLFTTPETAVGAGQPVAVISWAMWRDRFGGDRHILGRTITLNGRPHVVIGVTAQTFRDPFAPVDVWLPITSAPNPTWFTRENPNVWAIARLKPGVPLPQAERDLAAISADLAARFPVTNAGTGASVVSLRDSVVGRVEPILLILVAFVGAVLLIACANVANLQLARAAGRSRELSLRAALGASRGRVARQLLTESVLLSALGGAAGVLLAHWAIAAVLPLVPGGVPANGGVGVDVPVLAFCAGITIIAGLLFGAAPAWRAARTDLSRGLTLRSPDGGRGGRLDLQQGFVALQLALAIVLLVGAGLLTRSLLALQRVRPGFDPTNLLTAEFRLPAGTYRTPQQIAGFTARAVEAIRAVPGVRAAALVTSVPLSGNGASVAYLPAGRATPASGAPNANVNGVTSGYFATMAIPLLGGRDFTAGDRLDGAPVVIVNAELARREWPGRSAVGERLVVWAPEPVQATVVGVVGDAKQYSLAEPTVPQIYYPIAQEPGIFSSVVARADGDPAGLARAVRAAIWSVDPEQPVWRLRSMESIIGAAVAVPRFEMRMTVAFALLALLLAAVGVYGVMAYGVSQRTREMGIRMALGARRDQVVRLVLERGLAVVAVATACGVLASLGLTPLLSHELYGVGVADPVTFVVVPVLLALVALAACLIPARRAARVDPIVALRTE